MIPKCAAFAEKQIESHTGEKKWCSYYEDCGMDANTKYGRRWRVNFYYAANMSITVFFQSEPEKDRFLDGLSKYELDFDKWQQGMRNHVQL